MERKFIFALLTVLALSPKTHAERVMSWDDFRQLALEKNVMLKSSRSAIDATDAEFKSTLGGYLPSVSVQATRSETTLNNETSAGLNKSTSRAQDAAVSASLNVFNGFATSGMRQRASALKNQALASFRIQSSNVRSQLRAAYFNVYIQQERIRLYEKIVKRETQNQKLVGIKYQNGTEAQWNLHKTKSDSDLAQFNLESAQTDLKNAKEEIFRILDIDTLPEFAIEPPNETTFKNALTTEDAALNSNPTLDKIRFDVTRFENEKVVARAAFLPSIDLIYTKSKDYLENRPGETTADTWKVTATWNLFNGLTDTYKVQRASAYVSAAEYELRAARTSLIREFRSKADTVRLTSARIPLVRNARQAAEERLKTVSTQYRTGLKSYLDWEQAEIHLNETEQSEIQAKRDAYRALVDFENQVGKTLEEP